MSSPENFFAYNQFYKLKKDPATGGVRHGYDDAPPFGVSDTHEDDWLQGDPEWVTTRLNWSAPTVVYYNAGTPCGSSAGMAGHGIIGALRYIASQGLNSIYLIAMNLGGDGRDVHPFAEIPDADYSADAPQSCTTVFNYSVKRMQEWNTVLSFAMDRGVLVTILLHEQEHANIDWLGYDFNGTSPTSTCSLPSSPAQRGLTWARRLYLKQMVALFGHQLGIKWTLSEETTYSPGPVQVEFSLDQLTDMAEWIGRWDEYHDHPIAVHSEGNDTALYSSILGHSSGGAWLDATSMYIYGDEPVTVGSTFATQPHLYDTITETLRTSNSFFGPMSRPAVIDVDEQGSWAIGASGRNTSGLYATTMGSAEGRRRLVLYDVLLSGGNIEWYCGVGSLITSYGGGDIDIESFRTRDELWTFTAVAGNRLRMHPFWLGVPNDSRVTGETDDTNPSGTYGGAQVLENADASSTNPQDNFHLIYYPTIQSPPNFGSIDMAYAISQPPRTYVGFFVEPTNGQIYVSTRSVFKPTSSAPTHVPMAPTGVSPTDLIYVIYRL